MKTTDNNNNNSGGIGFAGLLTILFIALKLIGVINWPWILVLLPILITVAVVIIIIASLLFLGFYTTYKSSNKKR